jgi:hypothetical protein
MVRTRVSTVKITLYMVWHLALFGYYRAVHVSSTCQAKQISPHVQERCRVKQMFQEKTTHPVHNLLHNKVRPTEKN